MSAERGKDAIERFLSSLPVPEDDPELVGTPERVTRLFREELLVGYTMDPERILSSRVATGGSETVAMRGVDVTCVCPHHLMPAFGTVDLVYAPAGHAFGFGTLVELVRCYSRRLILQEALAQAIADALVVVGGSTAALCRARLTPTCVTARPGGAPHASTVTLAWSGACDDRFRASCFSSLQAGESGGH